MLNCRTNLCERINASQLARKIAASNRGKLRLKKARFDKSDFRHSISPSYLRVLSKDYGIDMKITTEIYRNTIDYRNSVECFDKIPPSLIRDYITARCDYMQTQLEFVQSSNNSMDINNGLLPFLDTLLTMGNSMNKAWTPIWDIVARNCRAANIAE